ncbi:hypothetical protein AMAG_10902 [Allomyces macrogynus ATCC 38327]|uniref:PDK1-type PH domain-containing protein n=1 Tax=Allomyces macrogynus (strain ATCC 38327) TaxID=578462 RepID=A0A0L0SRS0_ALLM3|nr:hypothetical protein AMAG_10902 [Allomyces macrogynus ATCC 38327]|eukprot:KNE65258.1 hypothetical protein AMAG_10902 [Allomyces macrogynus ATCC 38327]
MLVLDPNARITLADAKQHALFHGFDWTTSVWEQRPPPMPRAPPTDTDADGDEWLDGSDPTAAASWNSARAESLASDDDSQHMHHHTPSPPSSSGGGEPFPPLPADAPLSPLPPLPAILAADLARWSPFLHPGERLLKLGYVVKRKGLFRTQTRMLLVVDPPRLPYVDPEKMLAKGEIPWTPRTVPEWRSTKAFYIHTQPMRMNAGPFIEPAVYVPPPSLSIEYTTVVANEFQGALHRAMGDLDGKFRNLQHMCTALHAENDQLKREGYPAMVLEELERVKAKVARLERENEVLELQLREKTAALDAIRKCIPSAAPAPGEMLE